MVGDGWIGRKTTYGYDKAGRLSIVERENHKVEFVYDSLGRTRGVKKWTSSGTYTLEVKEYDLLDRVVEERTESTNGQLLLKRRYLYNEAGRLHLKSSVIPKIKKHPSKI